MGIRERLSGNEAIAVAMRQINPDVVAAFPITPSTEIPQYFSQFVANGQVETEFVAVESEHSAMSACIGAQAAGARTMTATSSNGLALMWEMLYIASAARLPITLACVNRALSGPLNIHNDHGDSMGARDSGWIQIYSENGQEAYDNFIQAVRIGENKEILLPVMVCQDGFITSHAVENIELLEDEKVKAFVGDYHPDHYLLNKQEHIAVGPLELPAHCFEHKRNQAQAMIDSKKVILDVAREYEKLTGRKYELFETYRLDDAEIAMIIINSSAGTAKVVVDALREKGIKAGLLKIRVFRPFPSVEIADALKHIKVLAVMDKAEGLSGVGGPLGSDIKSALYGRTDGIKIINYIYGLGGRDVRTYDLEKVFYDLVEIQQSGKFDYKKTIGETYRYIGVRE